MTAEERNGRGFLGLAAAQSVLPTLAVVFFAGGGWVKLNSLEAQVRETREDVRRIDAAVVRLEAARKP